MHNGVFVKGNVAINETGVAMRDSPKTFTVNPSELKVGELIGRGASSFVQRAVHQPTGIKLALKVINMFDKSKRDQLIKEIRTLYNAQCPALVSFYGAYFKDGAITIALEYMDGGSLFNVLSQLGPIPEKPLAAVTFQVLWGLGYLKHEKRVHRDIKPSNILINSLGEVKLSDFGVSAELQNSIAMCATFVGTFKYMSPERIRSEPYSYPSDVWSLGIVLIECLTAEYPYPEAGATYIEMVQTVLESPAPTLPTGEGYDFSTEAREFVGQCVQKESRNRLPADVLLGSPWLVKNGAVSIDNAVKIVADWIRSLT